MALLITGLFFYRGSTIYSTLKIPIVIKYSWLFFFSSNFSMQKDTPVLEVELDVDEMAKNHKA